MILFGIFSCFLICGCEALFPKSLASTSQGYFLRLRPYAAHLHGTVPSDLLADFGALSKISKSVSLIEEDEFFQSVQSEFSTAGMPNREQIRQSRQRIINFLFERVKLQLFEMFGLVGNDFEVFWIVPVVFLKQSDKALIETLASLSQIEQILPNNIVAHVFEPFEQSDDLSGIIDQKELDYVAWGVETVKAQAAWKHSKGERVRVGIIDTGVRYTHLALRQSYGGYLQNGSFDHNYNWFDPMELRNDRWWCSDYHKCVPAICCAEEPYDNVGHGTHVAATISGRHYSNNSNSITLGIAPMSQWMAAKGCRDGACLRYGLTKSAEWMICPTRLDGTDADCQLGADVINNSWGGGTEDKYFADITEMWRAVGIVAIFANGNGGPHCSTSHSPGDMANVISVGAIDKENRLSKFSSRGPGPNKSNSSEDIFAYLKPDLSAPGSRIVSASYKSDSMITLMSGTSMASPHVAGVVALMISAFKSRHTPSDMSNEQIAFKSTENQEDFFKIIQSILTSTCAHNVGEPHDWAGTFPIPKKTCANSRYTNWPNMFYGWGVVNAEDAVLKILSS